MSSILRVKLPSGEWIDIPAIVGPQGDPGQPGADGISPTVSVSKSGEVTTITITDKGGTKTATINDGSDGSPGEAGKDGATFYPSVTSDGTLSWTNDKGLSNPVSVNIKGDRGDTGAPGEPGDPGVYYGSEAPTDESVNVWIDTDGEPSGYEEWEFTLTDGTTVKKRVVLV